jgi:hypothetical protein
MTLSPEQRALEAIEAALKAWADRRLTDREALGDILDAVITRGLRRTRRPRVEVPRAANWN